MKGASTKNAALPVVMSTKYAEPWIADLVLETNVATGRVLVANSVLMNPIVTLVIAWSVRTTLTAASTTNATAGMVNATVFMNVVQMMTVRGTKFVKATHAIHAPLMSVAIGRVLMENFVRTILIVGLVTVSIVTHLTIVGSVKNVIAGEGSA